MGNGIWRNAVLGLAVAAVTSSVLSIKVCPASADELQVQAFGLYETAGVVVTLPPGTDGNESATAAIKGPNDADYRPGHDFVRYDANNMATSFFDLTPDTLYDIRVDYTDPDGLALQAYAPVRTKPEFVMPVPRRIVIVWPGPAGTNTLQESVNAALPGDEIRVKPGVFGTVRIANRILSADSPIVIRADDPANKPVIDGGGSGVSLSIAGSAYWIIDGLEVRNGGTIAGGHKGVLIDASAHIVVQNCLIHDNGYYNLLINHDFQHPGGMTKGGHHLIQRNTIYNGRHGIQLDNGVGAQTVIRGNTVYGHWDDIKLCGNEANNLDGSSGGGRSLPEETPHVLAITGGIWGQHDTDFYDNTTYGAQDNDIEMDGIGVNIRVFRNHFISDNVQSPVSVAPTMPGPFFITRNLVKGVWNEGGIKMNTSSTTGIPARNVFFYHNSIVKTGGPGRAVMYLWYDLPGGHNVPIKNFVFRNNVFASLIGGVVQATDAGGKSAGRTHPIFDDNLWFVPGTPPVWNLYEYQIGSVAYNYGTFDAFQSGTGQEPHGLFADPVLDGEFRLLAGSAAIDRAAALPGINDAFAGPAPDLGRFEFIPPPVNEAPVLTPVADTSVNEGAVFGLTLSASDPDGDALACAVTPLPAGAVFDDATGTLTWTPSMDQAGIYPLTASVTDPEGLSDAASFTLTVLNVNRPPTLNPVANATVAAGQLFTMTLSGSDPDGDPLTYSLSPVPAGAAFDPSTGQFSWTPGSAQGGSYALTAGVSDGASGGAGALNASTSFTVTVTTVNTRPVFTPIPTQTVREGEWLSFVVNAADPQGTPVTITASSLPKGSTFNKTTRTFAWAPSLTQGGSYTVKFKASDGSLSTIIYVKITVEQVVLILGGRVTTSTGAKFVGATVELRAADAANTLVMTAVTNHLGDYQMRDVAPGSYRVQPVMAGRTFTPAYRNITVSTYDNTSLSFKSYP